MRRPFRIFLGAVGAVAVSAVSALAQSATPAASAGTAAPAQVTRSQTDDVQQVREELARVKLEFDDLRRRYDERLMALEQRLAQIGSGPLTVPEVPAVPAVPVVPVVPVVPAVPEQSPPAGSSKVFNPDTSVIANFLGAAGKNPFSTQPAMQLDEAEVSFQAVVDAYAKADFFLAAGPGGLDIEEGYITFTSLPANLLLKVGKMRASFGKVNTLHTHAMPTADRPLVTTNLVGGEEGLSDSGMSLSHLIQNPALYLEATAEVFAGTSDVFESPQRSKLTYVGRLRGFRDITENSNIDIGTSYAFGPTNAAATLLPGGSASSVPVLNKQMFGIDAMYRYRPLRRAIYSRFNLRTELIWSRQDLLNAVKTTAFGFYGLGEYQFARRWYLGGRVDRSGRVLDGSLVDNGGAVFVTFWPTEFSQVRGQYRRINFAEGLKANEFLFQVNFSIGAHGAHVF